MSKEKCCKKYECGCCNSLLKNSHVPQADFSYICLSYLKSQEIQSWSKTLGEKRAPDSTPVVLAGLKSYQCGTAAGQRRSLQISLPLGNESCRGPFHACAWCLCGCMEGMVVTRRLTPSTALPCFRVQTLGKERNRMISSPWPTPVSTPKLLGIQK